MQGSLCLMYWKAWAVSGIVKALSVVSNVRKGDLRTFGKVLKKAEPHALICFCRSLVRIYGSWKSLLILKRTAPRTLSVGMLEGDCGKVMVQNT